VEAILAGKETRVPEDPNTLHVLVSMILRRVDEKSPKEALEHLLSYLMQLPPEFSVMAVKELQHKGVLLERCEGFKPWVAKFAHLIA